MTATNEINIKGQDYLAIHLDEMITQAKAAIAKWTAAVERDECFIAEFQETDPATAEIYRGWRVFDLEKVTYFQELLRDAAARLEKRITK